jgi:Glycosyl transferases group 1
LTSASQKWICCQLGAREHYSFARALHAKRLLGGLVTDAWVPPSHPLGWLRRNLRERYHPDLASAQVRAWNVATVAFELAARRSGLRGWPLILERNRWFQKNVASSLSAGQPPTIEPQPILFSYSYTALEPFRFAKARGWKTVLGQIDPGPPEEAIVSQLLEANSGQSGGWRPAPDVYWEGWRQECELADRIVVNSKWSEQSLLQEGISAQKIRVVPLAYDAPPEAADFERVYPLAFTVERPLRLLFLGQVNLRKGVIPILEAVRQLKDEPIEWWFVGPVQINVPANFLNNERIRWYGPVPRGGTSGYYREADVLLFPTFSDGFGLTQLEAQASRLPVIASRFCGAVVQDGVNGLLLPEVSADAIAKVLRDLVGNPNRLREFSARSGVDARFGLKALAASLLSL